MREGGDGGGGGGKRLTGGEVVNVEVQSDSLEGGGGGTRMRRGDRLPGIVVIW